MPTEYQKGFIVGFSAGIVFAASIICGALVMGVVAGLVFGFLR